MRRYPPGFFLSGHPSSNRPCLARCGAGAQPPVDNATCLGVTRTRRSRSRRATVAIFPCTCPRARFPDPSTRNTTAWTANDDGRNSALREIRVEAEPRHRAHRAVPHVPFRQLREDARQRPPAGRRARRSHGAALRGLPRLARREETVHAANARVADLREVPRGRRRRLREERARPGRLERQSGHADAWTAIARTTSRGRTRPHGSCGSPRCAAAATRTRRR